MTSQSELEKQLKTAIEEERTYKKKNIYLVNHSTIAKYFTLRRQLMYDFKMGQLLLENGISVPRELSAISFDPLDNYLLMERIEGKTLYEIDSTHAKEATRQYKKEINKVLNLGIVPYDSDQMKNSIYSEENSRLYLIDFEMWKVNAKPNKIERFRERTEMTVCSLIEHHQYQLSLNTEP